VVKIDHEDEVEEICEIRGAIEGVGPAGPWKAPQKLNRGFKKEHFNLRRKGAGRPEAS